MNTSQRNQSSNGSVTFITLDELLGNNSSSNAPNIVPKPSLQTNHVERTTSKCIECNAELNDFIITSYSNCEHYCRNDCIAKLKDLLVEQEVLRKIGKIHNSKRIFDIVITNMHIFTNYSSFLKCVILKIFEFLYIEPEQCEEMQELRAYLHGWLETFSAIVPREIIVASLNNTSHIKQIGEYFSLDK